MRIDQIAPLAEAVPPKMYGGTERVVKLHPESCALRSRGLCRRAGAHKRLPRLRRAEPRLGLFQRATDKLDDFANVERLG
jgi:hypothetical protein